VSLAVILVALVLANGNGQGQINAAEEMLEVWGVLTGSIDPDHQLGLRMLRMRQFQAFVQAVVPHAVLRDGERLGGEFTVGPHEGDAVTMACSVDSDPDELQRLAAGHGNAPRAVRTDLKYGCAGEEQRV
jgi:hypothetical protein